MKHVSIENSNYLEKLNNISWKYKDSFRDALSENNWKGNFLRIYPSRNSNIYDQFLHQLDN